MVKVSKSTEKSFAESKMKRKKFIFMIQGIKKKAVAGAENITENNILKLIDFGYNDPGFAHPTVKGIIQAQSIQLFKEL